MIQEIQNLLKHGKQFIPDLSEAKLPEIFRGLPTISTSTCDDDTCKACSDNCPTDAITLNPVQLDLGKCYFCGECANACPTKNISFTNNFKIATNERSALIIHAHSPKDEMPFNADLIRKEIIGYFGKSLSLRQVSAAGDNSCEMELGAAGNPNFDMGRYGIHFTASPRHADGIVITGPISENMATALEIAYKATPDPKIVVLVGVDAISGGVFAPSAALDRSFLNKYPIDLYIPGNPPHPLTFIYGILTLIRGKKF